MKIIELDKIIKKSEIAMIKVVKNKSRAKNLDIQQDTFADENVNDTWRDNKNGHHSNNQKKPKVSITSHSQLDFKVDEKKMIINESAHLIKARQRPPSQQKKA